MKTIDAYTMFGISQYFGNDHLYDGAGFDRCSGTVTEVITYLESLIPLVGEEDLTWAGQNGTWYSGKNARDVIAAEIAALKDGTHSSLNPDEEA